MKFLLSAFLIIFSLASYAQLTESLVKRINEIVPDCYDVSINSQKIISRFYTEGNLDSAEAVLEYWEQQCDRSDEMIFGRILFDIANDRFHEDKYGNLLQIMLTCKSTQDYIETYKYEGLYVHPSQSSMLKANLEYHNFTGSYSTRLLQDGTERKKIERDILTFFSGNPESLITGLKQEQYEGKLQENYNQMIADLTYDSGYFLTLYGGMWSPTENLSKLGNKPELGFTLGGFEGRYGAELLLGFRFVNSPVNYSIRDKDSVYQDNHFTSVTIGVQGYYSILKNLRNDLSLTTGVGYDEITIVPTDEGDNVDNVSTGTLNVNFGFQYRYYFDYKDYLGVDVRYSFLDFSNHIDNELSGNAISLRLLYGFTSSDRKKQQLKLLGY
ncbi:hypothetical protein Oweho_1068 [Owenweeksia hongkongensis DSM 17368]|uniref:Outer membrane protein beta-barrel domain-containing protein n=1 Tax=Owenweeksia hongkongensis (strain DSM 17368 / CIP 108786 / JCM 12287 / NRRL B-23963 / UST20020801) TaxID=926562 RepID=G8R4I6_OWEHD|nr:hypothetical protein [Owenweeksia hongkongensis]AEV32075.1 hypothetical protein Oweho_1068 [Owenweeksia hongkongensis DSM 17368]